MNIFVGKKYYLKKKLQKKILRFFLIYQEIRIRIHINQSYAKKMGFGKIVAHGMLSESFISAIIGNFLPGPGSLWAEKKIKFLKIVREADIINLESEVVEIHSANNLAVVDIKAYNQFRELVFDSTNKIILSKKY